MKNKYIDSSETYLLKFFKNKPQNLIKDKINQILNNKPSWPILYHLSPQREFLLDWYSFKNNSSLLEIGAGCGALTGMLCRKLKKVVANELEEDRAKIIKKRWSDKKNLKVISGNILNIKFNEKFNYVTLIGVLEYAGRFFQNLNDFNQPFVNLLKLSKSFLKKNGVLIIAIENKIGLKYIAGGKEDHYGSLFESLHNYPNYNGIKTFTKTELYQMLINLGFNKIDFYYPYPDYKLPYSIFSEKGIKKITHSLSSYIQIFDLSNSREYFINENIFGYQLYKENILDKFSNSFLIFAQI